MTGLTIPSVAIVISSWVTGHLTLDSLKTRKRNRKKTHTHTFIVNTRKIITNLKSIQVLAQVSFRKVKCVKLVQVCLLKVTGYRGIFFKSFLMGKYLGRMRRRKNCSTGNIMCVYTLAAGPVHFLTDEQEYLIF